MWGEKKIHWKRKERREKVKATGKEEDQIRERLTPKRNHALAFAGAEWSCK